MIVYESNLKVDKKKSALSKLRRLLKSGVVEFSYKKKDGTERYAKGTLKTSLLPEIDRDDERSKKLSDDCFYYYDLNREDWRCFLKDNFIGIKEVEKDKPTKTKKK